MQIKNDVGVLSGQKVQVEVDKSSHLITKLLTTLGDVASDLFHFVVELLLTMLDNFKSMRNCSFNIV
jgi:hypothetical protein